MVGVLSSWRDNIKPRMHPTEDGIVTWKEYDKRKSSDPLEPAREPEFHLLFQRAEPCIQTRRHLPGWGWGRTQKVVHTGQLAGFLEPDGEEHGSWIYWDLGLNKPVSGQVTQPLWTSAASLMRHEKFLHLRRRQGRREMLVHPHVRAQESTLFL